MIFTLFVVLNISFLKLQPANVYNLHRIELSSMPKVMNEIIKPKKDDLILIPYSGNKVMRYIPQGNLIHFFMDDGLLLKDKPSLKFYFDREFIKYLNKDNVKKYMDDDINQNSPFILYHIILGENHMLKMKKGQRFILISYRNNFIQQTLNKIENQQINKNENMFLFLMAKVVRDTILIADRYLKPINTYTDKNNLYTIYVYEKQ